MLVAALAVVRSGCQEEWDPGGDQTEGSPAHLDLLSYTFMSWLVV